jgi:putative copper resistance protein D
MSATLLGALWTHLAACVLLMGSCGVLLLAGRPRTPTAARWDARIAGFCRLLVLAAIVSGVVWLLARTAVFENRPHAAVEPRTVWHVVLDTWPGLVWLARHGLLIVLGAFMVVGPDVTERRNWIAVRGEALLLASLALALGSASSHAAAISPGTAQAVASDVAHLLGTGLWLGGLLPLALLLWSASRDAGADARPYAVLAARRFSRVALIAMLVLVASGVLNALAQVESVGALMGTTHGRLLLAKLVVLVPILALAVVNRTRILPAVGAPSMMRRLAAFVALEAALALVLLALAAAMTLTTPARHAPPTWPLPFRLSPEVVLDVPAVRWRVLVGTQLVVGGVVALLVSMLIRRRVKVLAGALALVVFGVGIGLPPIVVSAYPTSYRRPLLTYHAGSIASGAAVYREHCAGCHGTTGVGAPPLPDLRSAAIARRHAGELFWLVTHGVRRRGMPPFDGRLAEAQRWDVINYIRALGAAETAKPLGGQVEPDRAWLVAPDFTVAVGPLAPTALRDYRGRRMVLLVLYTLPGSRARMSELARMYEVLWVTGVEVVAVPAHATRDAIGELGAAPPILFPVVTDGAADVVATYRMLAPGPHAELLIDRQGYVRAIWSGGSDAIQAQVEKLNAEKSPPPFPDDHVH